MLASPSTLFFLVLLDAVYAEPASPHTSESQKLVSCFVFYAMIKYLVSKGFIST